MTTCRSRPCRWCPYRRDVPSGIWATDHYLQLAVYDRPTWQQPVSGFRCHESTGQWCSGWATCHSNRGHDHELLALRLPPFPEIPSETTPLWTSGTAAAEHGLADIDEPSAAALDAMADLQARYPHLRTDPPSSSAHVLDSEDGPPAGPGP